VASGLRSLPDLRLQPIDPPERALQRLQVRDLDCERREITLRDGKRIKDRVTLLPRSLVVALQLHLREVRRVHQADIATGWRKLRRPAVTHFGIRLPLTCWNTVMASARFKNYWAMAL
jgi:integrase